MKKVIHILLTLTFVSGAILLSNNTSADSSETVTTTITVPIACTMQGSGTTHAATLAPSTYSGATGSEYENGIGKTTLTAICNDDNGFAIYAVGYTGNSYDSENHTKLVGQNTLGTISTKVYASGDTASNWSMKLNKITDATESYNPQNLTILDSFDSWHTIPDTYTKVAQYKANTGSSTTDMALGVKLETTYAAYVAANQPADTYVGQVKYTMVHPYSAAEPVEEDQIGVLFNGNGSTFSNNTTTNRVVYEEVCASECNIEATSGSYSTPNPWYGSWYADINGVHYDFTNNDEIIAFLEDNSTTLLGTTINLYRGYTFAEAYTQANKSQTGGYYVVQDLNNNMCQTIAISQTATLLDSRDSNTYLVGRLSDGNCWITDNLRLDPTNSTTAANMNANNTNAPAAAISNYLNGGGGTTGWSSTAVANVTTGFTSYTAPMINNAYKDSVKNYCPDTECYESPKFGVYYNFCAATVGTYCYDNGQGVDLPNTQVDAPYDICPANWNLPTQNNYQFFYQKIMQAYEDDGYSSGENYLASLASFSQEFNPAPSDYFYNNQRIYQGDFDNSYIWSSTFNTTSSMKDLNLSNDTNEGYYRPHDMSNVGGPRNYGYSVRCIISK